MILTKRTSKLLNKAQAFNRLPLKRISHADHPALYLAGTGNQPNYQYSINSILLNGLNRPTIVLRSESD